MVWRRPYETRQLASVRLIGETLSHFAVKPELLRPQRRGVIAVVATAFEAYSNNDGPLAMAASAKVIVSDDGLYDFLKSFTTKYASL